MTTTTNTLELNRELANQINQEALANPHSPYAGKFVGIANGKVVVVSEDLDEVGRVLEEMEPEPAKTFWIEASRDYTQIEYVGLGDATLPPEYDEWSKISMAARGIE